MQYLGGQLGCVATEGGALSVIVIGNHLTRELAMLALPTLELLVLK